MKKKTLSLKFVREYRKKPHAEGDKLRAEGYKLHAEGSKLWAEAILSVYGNIKLEWSSTPKGMKCVLETGEEFLP